MAINKQAAEPHRFEGFSPIIGLTPSKDCLLVHFDSIRRRWTRCTEMSSDEMHSRIAQEFHKRSDLVRTKLGHDLGNFPQTSTPGNFLFRSSDIDGILNYLRSQLPEAVTEILRRADQICEHRFDLLGYSSL